MNWNNPELKNVTISGNTPSPSQGCVRTLFKVGGTTSEETSITMPSDINIIRMEATNKYFAQIKFEDKDNNVVSVVNPSNNESLPHKALYVNGEKCSTDGTSYQFKYTSYSPHVAYNHNDGYVA